jgi:DNA (cytosine-5)-methyltransferase 1
MKQLQLLTGELIIDNFAGGGGTSTGLEAAFGRPVDIAINHDPEAVKMHTANHPHTRHYCESVWEVNPREITGNQPVGLVWLSPDCKHFSKAKGGNPVEKKIRGLAWVALRWAATVRPRVIMLENVEEFVTWGPLVETSDGKMRPCPKRKGKEFRSFVNALSRQGYQVEWKELRACDYGAPTIRKRLFMIARRDGLPICWPAQTHGDPDSDAVKRGKLLPWRTAAECIDFSLPCPSIFEREKPLAENTLRRIAKGVMRYVVNAGKPFIVKPNHTSNKTVYECFRGQGVSEPLQTITQQPGFAVVSPTLVQTGYGEREGQSPRALDIHKPLGTLVGSQKHALVSAFLAKHYTGVVGSEITDPVHTVTAQDHNSLVSVHVQRDFGASVGATAETPLGTTTAGGQGKSALVASNLVKLRGDNVGQATTEPLRTISAGGTHHAEVRAFLVKYYGNEADGIAMTDPLHTVTARDRFGIVTVNGEEYQITDIGMRMLQPRELFRAQGFPENYIIGDNPEQGLSLTKTAQVRMVGNSVCPPVAQALVEANFRHELKFMERMG